MYLEILPNIIYLLDLMEIRLKLPKLWRRIANIFNITSENLRHYYMVRLLDKIYIISLPEEKVLMVYNYRVLDLQKEKIEEIFKLRLIIEKAR